MNMISQPAMFRPNNIGLHGVLNGVMSTGNIAGPVVSNDGRVDFTSPESMKIDELSMPATRFAGGVNETLAQVYSDHAEARWLPLTAQEKAVMARLVVNRPTTPEKVVYITDPNRDPDDLVSFMQGTVLQDLGYIEIVGAVTTHGDESTILKRAQFAKKAFSELRSQNADIRVAAGTDVAMDSLDDKQVKDHNNYIATEIECDVAAVEKDGQAALVDMLQSADDHSLNLVAVAGQTDPAWLVENHTDLFKQKVKSVTIMGGIEMEKVEAEDGETVQQPVRDDNGFVVAEASAYNNGVNLDAARTLYQKVQELGVPLTVVDRTAAYEAAVPVNFFSSVDASNHPVGKYVHQIQYNALKGLVQFVVYPNFVKQTPDFRLTPSWFANTFTDLDPDNKPEDKAVIEKAIKEFGETKDFEKVWQHVTKLSQYDSLTLFAAIPAVRQMLYEPKPVVDGHPVFLVGGSEIKAVNDVRLAMQAMGKLVTRGALQFSLDEVPNVNQRYGKPQVTADKNKGVPAEVYPLRAFVPADQASWSVSYDGYNPVAYTAKVVEAYAGIWADPAQYDKNIVFADARAVSYVGPIQFDPATGMPLNPNGRTGITGRGALGKYGPNYAADPIITRIDPRTGSLQVLLIERDDEGGWAIPGGMVDAGEVKPERTLTRELGEETGAKIDMSDAAIVYQGMVDDPRNTDNAWIETTAAHKHLAPEEAEQITIKAGDDATNADWVDVNAGLLSKVYASHGIIIAEALRQYYEGGQGTLDAEVVSAIESVLVQASKSTEELRDEADAAEIKAALELLQKYSGEQDNIDPRVKAMIDACSAGRET